MTAALGTRLDRLPPSHDAHSIAFRPVESEAEQGSESESAHGVYGRLRVSARIGPASPHILEDN